MRLAIVFVVLAACGGKGKQAEPPATGSGGGPVRYAKKIVVSWGIQQRASAADVFLQTTDETGKQVSHPLGSYPGTCNVIHPAEDMKALTGVACLDGATGTQLHALVAGQDIVVLKLHTDDGVTPDPMAREEIQRVAAPGGAAIEAAP